MLEESVSSPARASTPAPPRDALAARVEDELHRLKEARPHLASRVDRAATVLVVQLSSSARTRPIRCRLRKGGRRVYLVASLSSGGAVYEVCPDNWTCSCPDHHRRGGACKHSLGAWILWRVSLQAEAAEHLDRIEEINGQAQRNHEIPCSGCGEVLPRDRLIEVGEGQAEETLNPGSWVCRLCAPRHGLPVPRSSHEEDEEAPQGDDDEGSACAACQGTTWIFLAEDITDPSNGEVGKAHNPVRCRACEPATPPHLSDEEMREWMDSVRWRYAKTMPTHPHDYSLREWNNEGTFRLVVQTIWERGFDRIYLRRPWRSLDVGDFYIWIAGAPPLPAHPAPVETTQLINRARRVQERLEGTS